MKSRMRENFKWRLAFREGVVAMHGIRIIKHVRGNPETT